MSSVLCVYSISTANPRGRHYCPPPLTGEKTRVIKKSRHMVRDQQTLAAGTNTVIIIVTSDFHAGLPSKVFWADWSAIMVQPRAVTKLGKWIQFKKKSHLKKKSTAQRKPQTAFQSQMKITLALCTLELSPCRLL